MKLNNKIFEGVDNSSLDKLDGWIKTGRNARSPQEGETEMIDIVASSIDSDVWRKNNPPGEGGY